jgi:hypothetical protein
MESLRIVLQYALNRTGEFFFNKKKNFPADLVVPTAAASTPQTTPGVYFTSLHFG